MPRQTKTLKKKSIIQDGPIFRTLILAVSIALMVVIFLFKDELKNLSNYGYLGIFVVNFISSATVLLPLPGTASVFIGGSIWNPVWVGIFSGVGSALGELFSYFLGYGGRGLLRDYEGKKGWIKKTEENFQKNGFKTTFLFALLPLPIFDVVGLIAGAVNYPVWKFFSAMILARTLRNIVFAFTGTRLFD